MLTTGSTAPAGNEAAAWRPKHVRRAACTPVYNCAKILRWACRTGLYTDCIMRCMALLQQSQPRHVAVTHSVNMANCTAHLMALLRDAISRCVCTSSAAMPSTLPACATLAGSRLPRQHACTSHLRSQHGCYMSGCRPYVLLAGSLWATAAARRAPGACLQLPPATKPECAGIKHHHNGCTLIINQAMNLRTPTANCCASKVRLLQRKA
jgi:hypothetical protein